MPKFGKNSKERLATCDERLQKVFNEVIKYVDCSVTLMAAIIITLATLLMSHLIQLIGVTGSGKLFLLVSFWVLLAAWASS